MELKLDAMYDNIELFSASRSRLLYNMKLLYPLAFMPRGI